MSRVWNRAIILGAAMLSASVPAITASGHAKPPETAPKAPKSDTAATHLLDFLRNQNSTGFLVIQDGRILVEKYWPAPNKPVFQHFLHGHSANGVLLEDAASQQKSFIAVLVAIARDKGLVDLDQPVSAYVGTGWSKAIAEQEARITVRHLLEMNSGLDENFAYRAEPGSQFLYNTPVYAVTARLVSAAAKQPLDVITREWLTEPAGMAETSWRQRPAALGSPAGNSMGLVTTPRDIALFGVIILNRGIANNGTRLVSEAHLEALFNRSATNPAYGQLWWLNGGNYTIRGKGVRNEGSLVPAAPADMVGAYGLLERRLYVVPSQKLIIVRTGAASGVKDFDQQLWIRLNTLLDRHTEGSANRF